MHEAEQVGGLLFHADDPFEAARVLAELLLSRRVDAARARAVGLEPLLIESLKRRLPTDRRAIELACASGAGWVLGCRSARMQDTWEVVATLPDTRASLPAGLRRTTGETLIGLAAQASHRIRLAAPYLDETGIGFLMDAIVAATGRGVTVELLDPGGGEPARVATAALRQAVKARGDSSRLHWFRPIAGSPFLHLKVMVVDGETAYVGSANLTGSGLGGRNLELGVLVRGSQVVVIEHVLDLYQEPRSGALS
jgi:phosphatidylserine/phosphatidylglycerophosphate/cardiolipin synthase-like enzyme